MQYMVSSFALGPVTETFPRRAVHTGLAFVHPHACGCLGPHRILQTRHAQLREGKHLPPASPSRGLRAPLALLCLLLKSLSAQSWRPGGGSRAGGGQLGEPRPLPALASLPRLCLWSCPLPPRRCWDPPQVPGSEAECHRLPCVPGTVCLGGRCSAPTGTSSRGQAADRPELVPSVGVGREVPGCGGKQVDWGASWELWPRKSLGEGSPDPALGPESGTPLLSGQSGGPWGWTCVYESGARGPVFHPAVPPSSHPGAHGREEVGRGLGAAGMPPQPSLRVPSGRRHLGPCAEPSGSSTLLRADRVSEARESRCPCPGW